MKIFTTIVTVLVLLCAPVMAQEHQELLTKASSWEERHKDQPYIALINEYETTLKPDWSYEESYHTRIKIQKEEAKDLGRWPIYYNASRDAVIDIKAYVEAPDGRRYTTVNIEDMPVYDDVTMYHDVRMKLVTLEQVEVGSIIELTVRSTTTQKEIPGQFWGEILYPAIPTKLSKHVFIVPEDKALGIKSYKTRVKPLVERSQGKVIYSFIFENTDPIPADELLMPPLQEILGGTYLSSMKDWRQVADWYRQAVNKATIDDAEITVRALTLTKGKKSQQQKAIAIMEFIQDNFRLIPLVFADNMVLPNPTTDILRARYGDSKDLALLTRQMLKLAGIEADMVLFNSEYAGDPQHGLPSPSVFSGVLLKAKLDGRTYFLDPALKGFDLGRLPSAYDNAPAFVISDEGFAFERLPVGEPQDHAMISRAEVMLEPDGSAEFRVHITLPQETSQSFRESWKKYTDKEKEEFFVNLERGFAKQGRMLDKQISGIDSRYGPIEIDFRYQAPGAYPIVNDMMLIKEEDQSDIPEFVSDTRKYPVFMPNNSWIKNTNIYKLPDGFKTDTLPPSYSLSVDLMEASVKYQQKEETIQVDSSYRTKRALIPTETYPQIKNFRKELAKKNEEYIILKKSSNIPSEAKDFIRKQ